jgi:three-Cys-motif partner protein
MSKKQDTVWEAQPHTLAKVAILRSYLEKWFAILGRTFAAKDLWYIDGFAGPGEYQGGQDGSPKAAIEAATRALRGTGGQWKAEKIRCVFVEEDAARFTNLKTWLDRSQSDRRVQTRAMNSTFVEAFTKLKHEAENPFQESTPVFAFIDPFGATDVPFTRVRELLSRPKAELLMNLDSDGIDRIYRAGKHADHERLLTEIFDGTEWRSLDGITRTSERVQAILALYKTKLRAIPGVRYVFSFEMQSRNSSINYHLVFASQHSLGLEKMKESMKQLDQDGSYRFCDENVGQARLFRFDDLYTHARSMLQTFQGTVVEFSEVNDYALLQSPFVNAKGMLKDLESRGFIEVIADGPRRKGTYPDDRLKLRIRFREGVPNG